MVVSQSSMLSGPYGVAWKRVCSDGRHSWRPGIIVMKLTIRREVRKAVNKWQQVGYVVGLYVEKCKACILSRK